MIMNAEQSASVAITSEDLVRIHFGDMREAANCQVTVIKGSDDGVNVMFTSPR